PVDLRLQPGRAELPPGPRVRRARSRGGLAQRAQHRDGVGHRGQRVARLPVLRHQLPGRDEGHPGRAVRGGRGGRGHRAAAVPPRHAARHPQHRDHRAAAVHHLDLQRLRDHLHPHQGRAGRRHHGPAGADLRDRLRRPASGRGHRGRALHAAPAGLRDHRAFELHAARAGAVVATRVGRRSVARIERTQSALSCAVLLTFLLFVIFPFYWMIVTSFKGETQMRSLVSMFWPSPFVADNYRHLLDRTEFVSWYRNSIIVAVSSTLVATAVGTLGAYALARLKFLGRAFMASTVLITYLVPPSILFIPLYAQIRNLGMADSLTGLIAAYPSFTVPFVTWLLMGYFESIPVELEESAMIDGATRFGAFRRVILPLAAPGLLASALYAFTQAWNEFLYALVFITNVRLRTLPVGL